MNSRIIIKFSLKGYTSGIVYLDLSQHIYSKYSMKGYERTKVQRDVPFGAKGPRFVTGSSTFETNKQKSWKSCTETIHGVKKQQLKIVMSKCQLAGGVQQTYIIICIYPAINFACTYTLVTENCQCRVCQHPSSHNNFTVTCIGYSCYYSLAQTRSICTMLGRSVRKRKVRPYSATEHHHKGCNNWTRDIDNNDTHSFYRWVTRLDWIHDSSRH